VRAYVPGVVARVSIPFIAGQWSLPAKAGSEVAEARGLNPLHCGAVVASRSPYPPRARRSAVSIPFIAGQWSLRGTAKNPDPTPLEFQSPSLRGSGRFLMNTIAMIAPIAGFNPLHCGAVVASSDTSRCATRARAVSIPFIAGQWSLPLNQRLRHVLENHVSIPFIAGQWSLHLRVHPCTHTTMFQSPSLRGSGRFTTISRNGSPAPSCFNPLHCGAVVASYGIGQPRPRGWAVSIPFIAGQWSLLVAAVALVVAAALVSIPFIAGQWSLLEAEERAQRAQAVSIPFIAGQWSLPGCRAHARHPRRKFQSPSLRGSGRFPPNGGGKRVLRGRVSIPFIAGQWSLHAVESSGIAYAV